MKHSRTLARRFSDYITLMVIAPVLVAISTSASILVADKVKDLIQDTSTLGTLGPVILFLLNLSRYIVMWALLTLLYVLMPNTGFPFGPVSSVE